jgi:hypothetical protein
LVAAELGHVYGKVHVGELFEKMIRNDLFGLEGLLQVGIPSPSWTK